MFFYAVFLLIYFVVLEVYLWLRICFFGKEKAAAWLDSMCWSTATSILRAGSLWGGYRISFVNKLVTGEPVVFDLKDSYALKQLELALNGTPLMIISNHQSMADMPFIYYLFSRVLRLRFIVKKELRHFIPFISHGIHLLHYTLDRQIRNPKEIISQLSKFAEFCRKSQSSIVFFPEGTRAKTEHLGKLHRGAMRMLLEATHLPVVVVRIYGLSRVKVGFIPFWKRPGQHVTVEIRGIIPFTDVNQTVTQAIDLLKQN